MHRKEEPLRKTRDIGRLGSVLHRTHGHVAKQGDNEFDERKSLTISANAHPHRLAFPAPASRATG